MATMVLNVNLWLQEYPGAAWQYGHSYKNELYSLCIFSIYVFMISDL